jgi:predicted flap endonuclease-1-like 5' DNA nuclease
MTFLTSGWFYLTGIILAVFIVVWALLTKRPDEKEITDLTQHFHYANHEIQPDENEPDVSPGDMKVDDLEIIDNLEIIEGIGPKIAQLLRVEGINTYNQLSNMEQADLRAILDRANLRIIDPGTWPRQARLAADSDFQSLQEYQKNLKGGVETQS